MYLVWCSDNPKGSPIDRTKLNHAAIHDVFYGFLIAHLSIRCPLSSQRTYILVKKHYPPFIYSQFSYFPSNRAFSGYRSWYIVNKSSIPFPFPSFTKQRSAVEDKPGTLVRNRLTKTKTERNFVTAFRLPKPHLLVPHLLLHHAGITPSQSQHQSPSSPSCARPPFWYKHEKKFVKRRKSPRLSSAQKCQCPDAMLNQNANQILFSQNAHKIHPVPSNSSIRRGERKTKR